MKALAPKASKLNPIQGFKRIFGMKALVELTKAVLKFSLVGSVLYIVVSNNFNALLAVGFMGLEPAMTAAGNIIASGVVWGSSDTSCCRRYRCTLSASTSTIKR